MKIYSQYCRIQMISYATFTFECLNNLDTVLVSQPEHAEKSLGLLSFSGLSVTQVTLRESASFCCTKQYWLFPNTYYSS